MLQSLLLVVLLFCSILHRATGTDAFFYYAYGSNLLSNRILIKNPTAVFYGPAKLSDYRLDFNMQVPMWNGAVATIVRDKNSTVWGDLWLIDSRKMKDLDNQEGIGRGWYYPKNVTVKMKDGNTIVARTYIETHNRNPTKLKPGGVLPYQRRPSDTYLKVIIFGAIQSDLPAYYIEYLKTFPTNNKKATKETLKALGTVIIAPGQFYNFDEDKAKID